MKKWAALFTGLLLSACSHSPDPDFPEVGRGGETGPCRVSFIPANPVATEDLRVAVSGAQGKIVCEWAVNGRTLKGMSAPELPRGSFRKGDRVEVRVASGTRVSHASTVIGNAVPAIAALPVHPAAFHRGTDLTVAPRAGDPDGDPVRFSYRWFINGEEVTGETSATLPGDRFRRGDRLAIAVTPSDPDGEGSVFRSGEIEVPNAPPSFVSPPPGPFRSELFTYQPRAEDPDSDPLTYSLGEGPEGMRIDPASGAIRWAITPEGFGKHPVRIVAKDPQGAAASLEFTLDIGVREEHERQRN